MTDDEEVGFLIVDPTHLDTERGEITPDAFAELTKRDLSVARVTESTPKELDDSRDQLIQRGKQKTPTELRLIQEVCVTSARKIRAAKIDDERIFAIYDTALEGKLGHASIFTSEKHLTAGKQIRKRLRAACHDIFRHDIVPYEDFRGRLGKSDPQLA